MRMYIAIAIKHTLFTMPDLDSVAEPSPSRPDPYVRRTEQLFDTGSFNSDAGSQSLGQSQSLASLAARVRLVLDFMRSVNINLPILLWAISWNVPELVSDSNVSAERRALMVSKELPGILSHWRRPPRKHNAGIRTRAAYDTMNKFALDTVLELVGDEMSSLGNVFSSPQSELSEEGLRSIKWEDMATSVCHEAPTTWTLLRHAAYTQKQECRNAATRPDTVRPNPLSIVARFTDWNTVVCPNDDRDGRILSLTSPLQDTKALDDLFQELQSCDKGSRHPPCSLHHHEPKVVI
jgi:hypothetical protein